MLRILLGNVVELEDNGAGELNADHSISALIYLQ